ncbi:hypothetical protein AZL_a05040 (plasmid) [Azospirillum sp. B510]|uniref:type VI secretion system baseplate subunit TssF n=1 Tax=Azospirillum sp. (strain B510) TaxID=137722 RepID=UPI0001C4BC6D|nr:type VI secretion system baseplate subunit TssF [Azospirillum sp. B510]BAI74035.1 hypothetical protein AZL_a05040 [Azospirillum sp. B510]
MSFSRYYQDELAYLRDLGAEFAQENPTLAPFLARDASDPDVERLIEAFCFLTARIRQKLDDELPELSHSLVSLLWPNLLRPFPAMTILELEPQAGAVSETQSLPPGCAFQSEPVDGTSCVFRNPHAGDIHPVRLAQASMESMGDQSRLSAVLTPINGARLDTLRLDPLRFHLNFERDSGVGRQLLYRLTRRLRRVSVSLPDGRTLHLPASALRPVGFTRGEQLLPQSPQSFHGHILLQEYLLFPEKFLFFDLVGLAQAGPQPRGDWTIRFELDGPADETARLVTANLRINCVPVVNLFPLEATPLDISQAKTEYRLLPAAARPQHYGIFSIDHVTGWVRDRGERVDYSAFESFLHAIDDGRRSSTYYHVRRKPAVARDGIDTFLALVDETRHAVERRPEIVSVAMTCSNATLAEMVPVGGVNRATATSPTYARFRNISPVSPQALPPLDVQLLWRLIANLAVSAGSLTDIAALRTLIGSLDFVALQDQRARRRLELRLEALRGIEAKPSDLRMPAGYLLRGTEISLIVDEARLGGSGEAFLLGSVLNAFFGEASNINSFHKLRLCGGDSNWRCDWPVRVGGGAAP